MITSYKKEYFGKEAKSQPRKDAFNIEKEHKIINPHKMDLSTTCKNHFKTFKVEKEAKKVSRNTKVQAPIMGRSCYAQEFPNWKNGQEDIYHEKRPQFPYYSLPFAGRSSYQRNHTEYQSKELKRKQEYLA
jgi:hypothetical protein